MKPIIRPPSITFTLIVIMPILTWAQTATFLAAPEGLHEDVLRAFASTDKNDRQSELCRRLSEYLLSPDQENNEKAYAYLFQNHRWLDLTDCESLLSDFEARNPSMGNELLSLDTLMRYPKPERLSYYRVAIETGSVRLPHGFLLRSAKAMVEAARDGVAELIDVIESQYDKEDQLFREKVPICYLRELVEIRSGGESRDDAALRGVRNLADMEAFDLQQKLINNQAFFRAASETLDYVCEINPFDQSQGDGCVLVFGIYSRQRRLVEEGRLADNEKAEEEGRDLSTGEYSEWLQDLGNRMTSGISFIELNNKMKYEGRASHAIPELCWIYWEQSVPGQCFPKPRGDGDLGVEAMRDPTFPELNPGLLDFPGCLSGTP